MLYLFRLTALVSLVLTMLLITSCDAKPPSGSSPSTGDGDENDKEITSSDTTVPSPESYERGAVSFDSIVYSRPDTEALIKGIELATAKIQSSELSTEDKLNAVKELSAPYSDFLTMYSYLTIAMSKDASDEFYSAEYAYISSVYPAVTDAIESLAVAAATSADAERFEKECFGDGLIEKYAKGETLTAHAVELLNREAELEAEFTSLCCATVEITYDGVTDTYSNIKAALEEKLGHENASYAAAIDECRRLYEESRIKASRELFVELVRVRRLIADELGYDSYTDYAYENIYHEYTAEQMEQFTDDIAEYVVPVYNKLSSKLFYNFFTKTPTKDADTEVILDTLGDIYESIDPTLGGIYGFMMHYGLYDVDTAADSRQDGAYTAYLYAYNSPYIFVTASGTTEDYMTLAHEFGHFADSFINYNGKASIDRLETSSQALELLTLSELEESLGEKDYQHLYYKEMRNALTTLIMQGFYSKFEHLVYELSYNEITEERLTALVSQAAEEMNLPTKNYSSLYSVMTSRVILYPHYVQSYCPSISVALEIFFLEEKVDGEGIEAYKKLLDREGEETFIEAIKHAGLSSPFEDGAVKELADKIYYSIMGSHYYDEYSGSHDAENAA